MTSEECVREPFDYAAPAIVRIGGVVHEANTHPRIFEAVDEFVLGDDVSRSKSERYDILCRDREKEWTEASRITPKNIRSAEHVRTIYKIMTRSCVTPRASQLTNDWLGSPYLYPGSMCPLCGMARGEEYHILCRCGEIRVNRRNRFFDMWDKLIRKLDKLCVISPEDLVRLCKVMERELLPDMRHNFMWGMCPIRVRNVLHEIVGWRKTLAIAETVKLGIWEMYAGIYSDYMRRLVEKKCDFKTRLKQTHNLTPEQLSKHHKAIKARQFRERQAARIAGHEITQEMETDNNE